MTAAVAQVVLASDIGSRWPFPISFDPAALLR